MSPAIRVRFFWLQSPLVDPGEIWHVADVLWTENAENGYANVIDNTGPTYPLIQSEIVSQGAQRFPSREPRLC